MQNLKKKNIFMMLFLLTGVLICMMACGKSMKYSSTEETTTENINTANLKTEEAFENTELTTSTEFVTETEKEVSTIEKKEEATTEEKKKEETVENKKEPATEAEKLIEYTYTDFSKTMYATGDVNVRKLPDKNGDKVGLLNEGQKVEVTGKCNETQWYRIKYKNSCAYVSNKYLTEELIVKEPESSWVKDLDVAKKASQIIIVAAEGTDATVSMHTKDANGIWHKDFSTAGKIGKKGIGKKKEGDGKTPTGVYSFNKAFGVKSNPGISAMSYLQVDETHHWVDDSNSKYYNRLVSTRDVEVDWNSSEQLSKVVPQYNYALAINYNESCTPNKGSAIFLHCTSESFGTTSGCIAIREKYMKQVMKNLQSDCIIIIDSKSNVSRY